jgi:uncharacterized protein
MNVSSITLYPIKSTRGVSVDTATVEARGLQYDRRMALFDDKGAVVTARDYPKLLDINCHIVDDEINVAVADEDIMRLDASEFAGALSEVQVFDDPAYAMVASTKINTWFSEYLGTNCRLLMIDDRGRRDLAYTVGGSAGDIVSFADECPLLLVADASLDDLNSRLDEAIPMSRFRPNITVSGADAFSEDSWTKLRVGEVLFDVTQRCKRCVFTTLDADTKVKHTEQEPLRTLSTYRKHPQGGVAFGVHLVRRGEGVVRLDDQIELL